MSKDNILALTIVALVTGFAVLLSSLLRRATWRSRRPINDDVAYRMTLLHQQELLWRMQQRGEQQTRLIHNTEFYDYYRAALEENPGLTERAVIHLYMLDTSLSNDVSGRNSGQLEEES